MSKGEKEYKEELPVEERISLLITFIKTIIIPENSHLLDKSLGGWFPTYIEMPEIFIYELLTVFQELRKEFKKDRTPIFWDAGSGLGEIGAIAQIAGFKVFNIERNPVLHEKAVKYGKKMEKIGILRPNKTHYINGSFFTEDGYEHAVSKFKESFHLDSSAPLLKDAAKFLALEKSSLEEINKQLKLLSDGTDALVKSHMINGENGKFKADVIYNYAYDPLHFFGFADLMSAKMKGGAFVIAPTIHPYYQTLIREDQFSEFKIAKRGKLNMFSSLQRKPYLYGKSTL